MANSKAAEKRIRQSEKNRQRNRYHRSRMRTAIKQLRTSIEAGETKEAQERLPATLSLIDHTVSRGVVHENTAARYKSRLTRAVQALD